MALVQNELLLFCCLQNFLFLPFYIWVLVILLVYVPVWVWWSLSCLEFVDPLYYIIHDGSMTQVVEHLLISTKPYFQTSVPSNEYDKEWLWSHDTNYRNSYKWGLHICSPLILFEQKRKVGCLGAHSTVDLQGLRITFLRTYCLSWILKLEWKDSRGVLNVKMTVATMSCTE
jgi:hypothetical protein